MDGYDVYRAEDGAKGLEMALTERPDLILTDVDMPVMNGIELTKKLKNDDRTGDISVVISTGNITEERRREIAEAGADGYLPKPYDLEELRGKLREYLGE